jgi:aspartate/tyrosine/aromatic aminotransferase
MGNLNLEVYAGRMLDQLIPSRQAFPSDDPIFALNAEASARKAKGEAIINATVGALLDDEGRLVVLDTVMELYRHLSPMEVAPYAPIAGDPAFLTALVRRHWPDRADFGAACATPGGSGALALSIRNLLEPGQAVLSLAPYWGPYATITAENGARLETLPLPEPGLALDEPAWRAKIQSLMDQQGRLLLWWNDPCHNPTGRSASPAGRATLFRLLKEAAAKGPVTLLLDLAYLDYTAEPQAVREALDDYARFAQEGPVLVGAALSLSKAFTLYGARAGALAFPWTKDAALQAALAMSCRGIFSNSPKAPQSLLVKLMQDGGALARLAEEHRHWSAKLVSRARALDQALRAEKLPGVAWQGGFFVTLRVPQPQEVCARLKAHGVFVVPMPEGLRVGLCGLREADAPRFAQAFAASLRG